MTEDLLPVYLYIGPEQNNSDKDSPIAACAQDFARRMDLCIPNELAVVRDGGKPVFQNVEDIHFSVSHSKDVWAIAISQKQVGLDIQRHVQCNSRGIAKRFFHIREYEHLEADDYADFFDIWAAKESFVKFTGSGIDDEFSSFCVVENGNLIKKLDGITFSHIQFLPGYSACICFRGNAWVHKVDMGALITE